MVAKWSINCTYFLKNEFFLFLLIFVSVEIWVILTSILIFKKIGLRWLSIPVFCIWKCFFSVCVSTLREFSRFWYIALSLRWEKNYFPDSAYIVFTFLHCNSQILQTIWTHMLNNAFTSFLNVDFYLVKLLWLFTITWKSFLLHTQILFCDRGLSGRRRGLEKGRYIWLKRIIIKEGKHVLTGCWLRSTYCLQLLSFSRKTIIQRANVRKTFLKLCQLHFLFIFVWSVSLALLNILCSINVLYLSFSLAIDERRYDLVVLFLM